MRVRTTAGIPTSARGPGRIGDRDVAPGPRCPAGPRRMLFGGSLLSVALLLVGCTAPGHPAASAPAAPAVAGASSARVYSSTSFVVPFDATLPSWVTPGPKAEQRNFVTWDGASNTALRVMHPVTVYRPGDTTPSAVPADFLGYLRAQSKVGVHLSDQARVKAGPYTATLFTMTTSQGHDGSFGCPATGIDAGDCFGAQPDFALRMAVVRVRGTLLLLWQRDAADAKALTADTASFAAMVAGLRFPARAVAAEAPSPSPSHTATPVAAAPTAAVTPLDGTWRATITRDELANSPLLLDPEEVNSGNIGSFRLTFDRGTEVMRNGPADQAAPGRFRIHGKVLTIETPEGERFVVRWRISGNRLILTRAAELGIGPTPLVLKTWTRVQH